MTEPLPPSLSGTIILRNLAAFRAIVGEEAVERALAGLPEDLQQELAGLVPAAWIPVEVIDAFYAAIAAAAGRDLFELYPEIVRRGVSDALRTVWKMFLRLTSDRALVSRTPVIYKRSHNVGELATARIEPGYAESALTGWPGVPPLRLLGLASGIQATLEVAGRKQVEVHYEPTADGATFRSRWQA